MNALDWLDRAFALTRLAGRRYVLMSWSASAPLTFAAVFAFYLERVEGVRSARGGLALALAGAWCWRSMVVGGALRSVLSQLEGRSNTAPRHANSLGVAAVAGLVLGVALLPAAGLVRLGGLGAFVGFGLALPVGCLAPSWLARAGVAPEGGLRGWRAAVRNGATLRGSALLLHGFLLAGALLLYANVLAVVGMLLAALQGFAGVEVSSLVAFMSFENDFALVATAAITLWLMEPLRGAVALVALLHARSRRDGADLRRIVDALATGPDARGGAGVERSGVGVARAQARARQVASLALFITLAHGGLASAEPVHAPLEQVDRAPTEAPPDQPWPDQQEAQPVSFEPPPLGPGDRETAAHVEEILAGSAFREFADARTEPGGEGGQSTWFERLLEALERWLRENQSDGADGATPRAPMPVPPTWVFVTLAVVLLGAVVAYVLLTWRRDSVTGAAQEDLLVAHDPRDRAPEEHLDEAALLADQGRYREAFRSLYLATLVALDRHREIDFDPSRTNWHYQRQMGEGARSEAFRTFTRLFDRKWYGDEPTARDEYETGRRLATTLTAAPRRGADPSPAPIEALP